MGSIERAQDYENGIALISYLSPTDYHRVQSPVTGKITTSYMLGRESAPVNDMGLRFKRPLTRTYRRVTRPNGRTDWTLVILKSDSLFLNNPE